MDGLNEYQIFFKIFMPMMKSTYAAAGIFMFMASWNNYMWPLIALQSDTKFTLPLVVANLASGFTPGLWYDNGWYCAFHIANNHSILYLTEILR